MSHEDHDGWVEFAAQLYVYETLARDAEAARQAYWARASTNEEQLLIGLFNKYRETYPDDAAVWYAEQDFRAGYRDRLIEYFAHAPGYAWRWKFFRGLTVFAFVCAIASGDHLGQKAFWWLVAVIAWLIMKWARNWLIPRYADGFLHQEAWRNQYEHDRTAFQIARDGYWEIG